MKQRILFASALFFLFSCRGLVGGLVEVECLPSRVSLVQGEKLLLQVRVANGSGIRLATGDRFFLSYHLADRSGRSLRFDNRRFPLPRDVASGEKALLSVPVFFDLEPGEYRLQWDIVKEGEFWGASRGWKTAMQALSLRPLFSPEFRRRLLRTFWRTGSDLLDREQYLLRLTLANSENRLGREFLGFSAGSTYPALWIRDTATLLGYARFYYDWKLLASGVERFLERQEPQGAVCDWIDAAGRTGKNTVETDQESSLVLAAAEVALGKPSWLGEPIAGQPVLRRLERALEWVWKEKRDPATGLVVSGRTADWGDVENSYPDERALSWSDRSTPVLGIYTQAKYIQALSALVEMAAARGESGTADKWRARLQFLKKRTRRFLYLPEAGYYLIHRGPGSDRFSTLERGILAVGGNAEAMAAGLMTGPEIARFLALFEERRSSLGVRSASATLLPPYPQGFFPHPILFRPWSYQNGGLWDWIGGRLVKALYLHGFAEPAGRYLEEIAARHLRSLAIFEWEDREGNGQGALFYAGAAGVVGEAILEGYLGLREDYSSFSLPADQRPIALTADLGGTCFTFEGGVNVKLKVLRSEKGVCLDSADPKKRPCLRRPGQVQVATDR